jgi:alanine racemase
MIFLDHILTATHGILTYSGSQQRFDAFSHDTRQLIPGEMFVAVRGEHGDGHDFLLDAVERGAAGILAEAQGIIRLSEEIRSTLARSNITLITVPDTRIALQQYATYILDLWKPVVIAVTGSTGKTSTKEAIATVLSGTFATFRSWQNYNDLLGIPLSLGRLEERHEYAVLELSCDHPGEIADLCRITRPRIGVLTNISPSQLQYFGTVDRLANELATLLSALPQDGLAIVNADDCLDLLQHSPIIAPIQTFSPSSAQHVHVSWDGVRARCIAPSTLAEPPAGLDEAERDTSCPYIDLESHLLGAHHVSTMLAACIVGCHCGLQMEEIQHTLTNVRPMPGRLNPLPGILGQRMILLDDTHNATPASMIAGLETLRALSSGKRIAILGDMLRLGDYEEEAHRQVGRIAAGCADYLILRGERSEIVAENACKAGLPREGIIITATPEDAARVAGELVGDDQLLATDEKPPKVTVLIKGSEEMRMERVTERLMAHPEQAPEQLVRQTPGWKQIVVMRPERPTWVEIDLSAIANNTRQIKEIVGPDVRILASLKADAYGHGAVKVARTVLHNGASMIGVATVSEATPLRNAGVNAPILVFGYVPPWQMREAVHLDLTVTLYSIEAAQALSRAALALERHVKVHVKIDTGMGRLGVRAEQIEEVLTLLRAVRLLPHIDIEGIFTHFAMADTDDQTHVRMQLARFQQLLRVLHEQGMRPPLVHAANSAALLSLPEARFDMVRPGIALYGLDPSTDVLLPEGFRPALSFKTQVAHVKTVPAGECISYGCQYITQRPTRVATLPVGYADGFRRAPYNWGTVLLHGQEAPILGRVCMDQCMIDVTHIPQTRTGDEVILIGRQGSATMSAEQVAERLGTSNYEVVSAILARVPRVD